MTRRVSTNCGDRKLSRTWPLCSVAHSLVEKTIKPTELVEDTEKRDGQAPEGRGSNLE